MGRIRLRRIRIRNFASYDNAEINFEELDYPVFVVGDNGSGKTTLFVDAVTYGLYGLAFWPSKFKKEYISRYHDPMYTTEVLIEFMDDGKIYRVLRRIGPVTEHVLSISGKHIPYTSRDEVDRAIKECLGLDYRNMMETFIARQGGLTSFIEESPSERRKRLVELLNLNFEPIRERIKRDIEELRNRLERIRGTVNSIENIFKSNNLDRVDRDLLNIRISELENKRGRILTEIEGLTKSIGEIEDRLINISSIKGRMLEDIRLTKRLEEEYRSSRENLYKFIRRDVDLDTLPKIIKILDTSVRSLGHNEERRRSLKEVFNLLENILEVNRDLTRLENKYVEYKRSY